MMKKFFRVTATTVIRIMINDNENIDDYKIDDMIKARLEDKLEDEGRWAFDEIEYELIEEVL